MEVLYDYQENILRQINDDFRRYLHASIHWKQRMIGIKGPRGAGKTTLMLQHMKFDLDPGTKALYITADHTWFYNHSLLETAMDWYRQGGTMLFIDEVHKYPNWSVELKNIYDGLPGLRIVFSASSALDIYRGEADLSRRVITYSLSGLSFREYLQFTEKRSFDAIGFEELLTGHQSFSREITQDFRPIPSLRRYLQMGYLPIIAEGEETYLLKLNQIINAIVETDLAYIASYHTGTAVKVKKLLGVIAESAPFKPNISALSAKLDISRENIYQYIYQLRDAKLLNTLITEGKGVSVLQKPDKLYLENTNLSYALKTNPEIGTIRETFLLNQLRSAGLPVFYPDAGDFQINGSIIEVGGKNKTSNQVRHLSNYYIAADNIETGSVNRIPLWLFGFLY